MWSKLKNNKKFNRNSENPICSEVVREAILNNLSEEDLKEIMTNKNRNREILAEFEKEEAKNNDNQ